MTATSPVDMKLSAQGNAVVDRALSTRSYINLYAVEGDGEREVFENLLMRWVCQGRTFDFCEFTNEGRFGEMCDDIGVLVLHDMRSNNEDIKVEWGRDKLGDYVSMEDLHDAWQSLADVEMCKDFYMRLAGACSDIIGVHPGLDDWANDKRVAALTE